MSIELIQAIVEVSYSNNQFWILPIPFVVHCGNLLLGEDFITFPFKGEREVDVEDECFNSESIASFLIVAIDVIMDACQVSIVRCGKVILGSIVIKY